MFGALDRRSRFSERQRTAVSPLPPRARAVAEMFCCGAFVTSITTVRAQTSQLGGCGNSNGRIRQPTGRASAGRAVAMPSSA